MPLLIFAVFDRKTNSVVLIKEAPNIESFERWFASTFLRTDSWFALYPDDYTIYSLCMFDGETLEGRTKWSPTVVCDVSAIFEHLNLARPEFGHSGE